MEAAGIVACQNGLNDGDRADSEEIQTVNSGDDDTNSGQDTQNRHGLIDADGSQTGHKPHVVSASSNCPTPAVG